MASLSLEHISKVYPNGFEAVKETKRVNKNAGKMELSILTSPSSYSFFADGINLGSASYAGLCPEGAMYMTFTGTMLGIWSEEGSCSFIDEISLEGQEQ